MTPASGSRVSRTVGPIRYGGHLARGRLRSFRPAVETAGRRPAVAVVLVKGERQGVVGEVGGLREEGEAGLVDRSSRPHRSPRSITARVEERICRLRRSTRRGPVFLSARTGVLALTVWRILQRNGLNRLSWIDRPTGRVIRRYEGGSPGRAGAPRRKGGLPDPPKAAVGASTVVTAPRPGGLHLLARRDRRPLPCRLRRGPRR